MVDMALVCNYGRLTCVCMARWVHRAMQLWMGIHLLLAGWIADRYLKLC